MTNRNERHPRLGPAPLRPTPRERVFVLGGLGFAALATTAIVVLGAGADFIGGFWFFACLWTALASFACALGRGLRRGDWSAFRRYRRCGDGDAFDWSTRTGAYSYMRIGEEHERLMRGD